MTGLHRLSRAGSSPAGSALAARPDRAPQQDPAGGGPGVGRDEPQAVANDRALLGGMTLTALPENLQKARAVVAEALEKLPELVDAVLLADELFTNSMLHSVSGRPPVGQITVQVWQVAGAVRIEVTDGGGPTVPDLRDGPRTDLAEGGRGLLLVDGLARCWGFQQGDGQLMTWFELPCARSAA